MKKALSLLALLLLLAVGLTVAASGASGENGVAEADAYLYLPVVKGGCEPRYFDDFNDAASGWPITNNENYSLNYLDGQYQMHLKGQFIALGASPTYWYGFPIIVTRVWNVNGGDGAYGIILNLRDDWREFRVFMISPDKQFSFYEYDWYRYNRGENPWKLLAQGKSEHINGGSEPNTLKVHFNSGRVWLYINGHQVYYRHSLFELGYSMGLYAESYRPDLDVRFDYFGVYNSRCVDLVGGVVGDEPLSSQAREVGEWRSWGTER